MNQSKIVRTSQISFALLATTSLVLSGFLTGCNSLTYAQRESPANAYKDYRIKNQNNASVIGIGQPITAQQMAANATISLTGQYDVEEVIQRMAGTYNVAVRWGNGVRKNTRKDVVINNLTFDEARNYVEDVFDIQIIKEGERRLLVLPSASEPRLSSFDPGVNVRLSQALRGLAEQCDYNLIINENKEKLNIIRITTKLTDVTCFDAFEALLNPHGLSIVNAGDYYTIGGLPQRQWTVALFEPVRSEETSVNYSSDFSVSGDTGGGSQSAGGTSQVTIKYERDLWKDLENDLKDLIKNNCPTNVDSISEDADFSGNSLLPPPTGEGSNIASDPIASPAPAVSSASGADAGGEQACGYVRVNTSVGTVQMRAPASVLEEANDIIQRTVNIANRRIMLEARVLAVTKKRNFDQRGGFNTGRRREDGAAATQQDNNSYGFGAPGGVASSLSRALSEYRTVSGANLAGFSLKNQNLDAIISFLEQYSTTYQLMHPVMELMDRQRGTLIDGTNQKYFVVKSTTTTGTATSTSSDVEERSQFIGMQFTASAQISDNSAEPHTISLQIPITSQAGTVDIPTGISGTTAGSAPIANTRLIDQKVRIRDGEIKAIGGLTTTLATDRDSGLPIMRDIPALGKLANDESTDYQQVEFVVLLQVKRLD
jgi:hypothetical protein